MTNDHQLGMVKECGLCGAAITLLAAAFFLSPELTERLFSADRSLAPFVANRLQAFRLLACAASAFLLAWAALNDKRRGEAAGAARRWAARPASARLILLAGAALLATELRIAESEPCAEGTFTYGAWRTMLGEVPCRDFFSYVLPVWHYYLAGVFKLFGVNLDAARFFGGVLPKMLSLLLLYRLARLRLERAAAAAAAFLGMLYWSANSDNAQAHNGYLAVMFGLGAALLLARFSRSRRLLPDLAWAGLLAGLCAAVRQDFGVYALAAGLAFLAATAGRRAAAAFVLYAVVVVGGMAAAMATTIPLDRLHECFVRGPRSYMAHYSVRGLGLVPFLDAGRWLRELSPGAALTQLALRELPLALVLLSLPLGAWTLRRESSRGLRADGGVLLLLLLWTGFFLGHVYKGGANVYAGAGPGAVLLLACSLRGARRPLFWSGLALLAAFGVLRLLFRPFGPPPQSVRIATPAGSYLYPDAARAGQLSRALELARAPGTPILAHNPGKNCSDILFYVLAQRPAGTRYIEYLPGLVTAEDIQKTMIEEISRNSVSRVVESIAVNHGRSLSKDGPRDALDRRILRDFRVEADLGYYVVWKKR